MGRGRISGFLFGSRYAFFIGCNGPLVLLAGGCLNAMGRWCGQWVLVGIWLVFCHRNVIWGGYTGRRLYGGGQAFV